MVFLKWVRIPFLGIFGDNEYSVFQLFNFSKQIESYVDNTIILTLMCALYVLIASIIIIGFIIFAFRIIITYDRAARSGSLAFIMSIVLSAMFIFSIILTNQLLSTVTDGSVGTIIEITLVPVVMMIIGITGQLVVIRRIKGDIYNKDRIRNRGKTKTSIQFSEKVTCSKCGFAYNKDLPQCPACKVIKEL